MKVKEYDNYQNKQEVDSANSDECTSFNFRMTSKQSRWIQPPGNFKFLGYFKHDEIVFGYCKSGYSKRIHDGKS